MSEVENPVDTVIRLLSRNLNVVKADNSPAAILVSKEWLNRELLKDYDGQVTVGLAESRDEKLEFTGNLRRRVANLKVNVWSVDRFVRQKTVEEVNRVVRQNRVKPNETLYDFNGVGQESNTHKAYYTPSQTELTPQQTGWVEIFNVNYQKIWKSDDQRFSVTVLQMGDNMYPLMLFRFKVESDEKTVKKIVLTFEGYGTSPSGNGVTIKVWNHVASAWQNASSGTGGADETVTITLTTDITDYIDDNGYVWLLGRTTYPAYGYLSAALHCDYVSCVVTVNGITYLDIVSYRDLDRVDVKPIIYRTEFTLKAWMFETVS